MQQRKNALKRELLACGLLRMLKILVIAPILPRTCVCLHTSQTELLILGAPTLANRLDANMLWRMPKRPRVELAIFFDFSGNSL